MNGLRRWLGAAAVLAATLLQAPHAEHGDVRVVARCGRHAAWCVALEKGYYKRAGLDVTIVPGQGSTAGTPGCGIEGRAVRLV